MACHLGLDETLGNFEVADAAVAHVAASAREPVLVVCVLFQAVAPGLAPEGLGQSAFERLDGLNFQPLFLQLGQSLLGSGYLFRDRNVFWETIVAEHVLAYL